MLIENDKMLLKNAEVAKEFNKYFGHITDSLDLYEFPDVRVSEGRDDIDNIVYKFRNHPSIIKIKERYKVKENFSFRLATTEEIKAIIKDLPTNKAAGGEMPVNVLKKSNFSFDELTICVNYGLINGKFPITLKNVNVTPVHKKDDPTDKTNFRPISVLPLLSKVFERVIYNQLGKYIGINSVLFRACLLWNSLPQSIKYSESIVELKTKMKDLGNVDCSCILCR